MMNVVRSLAATVAGSLPYALACAGACLALGGCAKASRPADIAAEPSPAMPAAAAATAARTPGHVGTDPGHAGRGTPLTPEGHNRLAAFAAGCFWGVEDGFRHVPGVVATAVGYAGGHTQNPTYPQVCTHTTGHAETVLVEFDPAKVPYEQLLRDFWKIHDPTQVGGQGPDEGDSYRSIVFTFDDDEAAAAKASQAAEQRTRSAPITTEIRPMGAFWKAEDYHQQYSERTGEHGCHVQLPGETTQM
jgi:peptide-methionine (S)-S-oxide reductase